jgi:hypothetical protein
MLRSVLTWEARGPHAPYRPYGVLHLWAVFKDLLRGLPERPLVMLSADSAQLGQ